MRTSKTHGHHPVMNKTKWAELRLAMLSIEPGPPPTYRIKNLDTGYLSDWDGEWFYHFQSASYDTIEWVEIKARSDEQAAVIQTALNRVHVPLERRNQVFKVLGFVIPGQPIDYAQ
jgi:hypothetical protein